MYPFLATKINGNSLDEEKERVKKSRLIAEVQLLDHDRLELQLEHERLLRKCAKNDLAAAKNKLRRRREVSSSVFTYTDFFLRGNTSIVIIIMLLHERNTKLALDLG